LKPLSVTLPFAARFTLGETASRARQRMNNPAKAETVIVAKGQKGDAGAVFDLAPDYRLGVVRASSKWRGDGVRKEGEDNNPTNSALSGRDWRASWMPFTHKA